MCSCSSFKYQYERHSFVCAYYGGIRNLCITAYGQRFSTVHVHKKMSFIEIVQDYVIVGAVVEIRLQLSQVMRHKSFDKNFSHCCASFFLLWFSV